MKRVLLFKIISILMPFLLLFIVEISLRVFHYGHDLNLFIEYPGDSNFLVLNPDASRKYFSNQENATTGNIELFRKKKEENTLRIFVLGESTTIGYPYFHNGSFHRWLLYRLMHEYPDKHFEIINLSLTAVNSYTVAGFAKELVNYEPDAVLIYTGHNEYYGALGVGSTDRMGGNAAIIHSVLLLRKLRISQLLGKAFDAVAGLFGSSKSQAGKTRMEAMVADQQIGYRSALYYRGIDQFRLNMEATLRVFEQRQIPVFFSNLVSNEKDLHPFISVAADSLKVPAFSKSYSMGLAALDRKDTAAAYSAFGQADRDYSGHALCNYYLGRLAYMRGDFGQAKIYFEKARELDALRFRAPDTINTIIGQLCHQYKYAHLVDTKAAFEAESPHGIIGDELVLEHVHPNLTGYALLSDVFYEAMKGQGLFSSPAEKEMGFRQLVEDMPITKVDSLIGVYKVGNLKRSWPFRDTSAGGRSFDVLASMSGPSGASSSSPGPSVSMTAQPPDSLQPRSEEERMAYDLNLKQANWPDVMDSLYNYYMGRQDLADARKVVEALVLEHPTEEAYYEKAANLCGVLKDDRGALFYFRQSFSISPSFEKARKVFVLCLKLDRPADAIPFLDYAINNNLSGFNLGPVRKLAGEIAQLQKASGKDTANVAVLYQIADRYFKMGNRESAVGYVDKVLRIDPGNKEALSLQGQLIGLH